jgi:hypothetical protein
MQITFECSDTFYQELCKIDEYVRQSPEWQHRTITSLDDVVRLLLDHGFRCFYFENPGYHQYDARLRMAQKHPWMKMAMCTFSFRKRNSMAWLTLSEAVDALRQRLEKVDGLSPGQRILLVDVLDRWRRTLDTQQRAPDERRKCAICGETVPPIYVVDSTKHPVHIMCPRCSFKDAPVDRDGWPEAVTLTPKQWEDFKQTLFPLIDVHQPQPEPTPEELHWLFPEEEEE